MSNLVPFFAQGSQSENFSVRWGATPNVAAGNAQFFDPDPRCLIQVRPLLQADLGANGAGRKANALLWIRGENGGSDLVYYVRVPPHRRKNNRVGVMCGIKCIRRFDPELGRRALEVAARTRWPKPEARSWTR